MLKRFLTLIFAVVLSTVVLTGCGSTNNDGTNNNGNNNNQSEVNSSEVNEEVIQVIVSNDEEDEIFSEKEIEIKEGDILLDVLNENFDIDEDGGFINGVDGVVAEEDEQKFWAIIVNGEMAEVGAGEFELSPGDEVTLDLQSWE